LVDLDAMSLSLPLFPDNTARYAAWARCDPVPKVRTPS
jgi:hypothetical protein